MAPKSSGRLPTIVEDLSEVDTFANLKVCKSECHCLLRVLT